MLSEDYASILLNMESWEIFSPFTETHLEADVSSINKDITRHDNYEILVGLEGVYPYYYNDNCYNCKPGSIFLISPMLEHESYYTESRSHLTHMWMNVNNESLLATVSSICDGKMKCFYRSKVVYQDYKPELEIYEIWNSLLNAKKITPQNMFKLKLAISHLFLVIIENKQLSINEYQNEIMQRARNYIKAHFRERINLNHLASKMGYSKFHFVRLFKQYHTVTVQEYIDQQRLKEVKTLSANKVTKKEIAYKLNFSSPSAFANWYAKYRNV
jgi:AraC-like DNA-binding protein